MRKERWIAFLLALPASVAGGLAVMAAVVLSGFEFAGFWVNSYALAIGPESVSTADVIAHGSQG
jgi:hypothetical protein